MLANYHTHTRLCDGTNTPAEMAAAAYRKGFAALGFSGHMDPSVHMNWTAYCDQIRALQTDYAGKMDILLGVELDQVWPRDTVPGAEYVIIPEVIIVSSINMSIRTDSELKAQAEAILSQLGMNMI